MGMNNTSSGHYSSSLGIYTRFGSGSNAFGMDNTASSSYSTTIGRNNCCKFMEK